jgi:hypothetical protein
MNIARDDIEIEIRRFRNFSYMLSESTSNRQATHLKGVSVVYCIPDVKITGLKLTGQC